MDAAQAIRAWRESPTRMVRDLFGVEPDLWQQDVLEAFPNNQRLAMKASKGVGKTALLAWLAWNFLLTRPHPKIAATSITGANLADNLWSEMALWLNKSPLLKATFTWTKTRIFAKDHPETWWMSARPWSQSANKEEQGNTLAGLHADYIMFLLDESGGIPDSVMISADAALSSCIEGHIVQAGNPTHLSGPLYRACTNERRLWHVTEISSDPENPKRSKRVSVKWAQDMIDKFGRDNPYTLINVFGQFPPHSLNSLIGPDEVGAAMKRYYRPQDYESSGKIIGIDVARDGLDSTVIFTRQGIQAFPPQQYRNIDGTQGAGLIARKWTEWDADACFIDNTGGFGSSWIDNLLRLGKAPVGVHFSEKPANGRYFNKRTEMIFDCVEWIKRGGGLPEVPELVEELTNSTYTFKGDKMLLEPKDALKEKIGRSPDHLDSLCLVGMTVIATPSGERLIKDLGVGDVVLTPFGHATIKVKWRSQTNRLTSVKFSNGAVLVGKPDHKIYSWHDGHIELDGLTLNTVVSTLKERPLWTIVSSLSTRAKSFGFKRLVDIIKLEKGQNGLFIGVCGLIATDQSQKALSFITRTITGATTRFPIWNYAWLANTSVTTWPTTLRTHRIWRGLRQTLTGYVHFQPLGTEAKQATNGIALMQSANGLTRSKSPNHARHVLGRILRGCLTHSIVQAHVPKGLALGVISRNKDRALNAAARLWRTVTGKLFVVPVFVQTEDVEETSVYNLTLDRDNAYYANGVLVFNCLTFAHPVQKTVRQPTVRTGTGHSITYNPLGRDYIRQGR